jgi:hypothetical protein
MADSQLAGQVGLLAAVDDRAQERGPLAIRKRRHAAQRVAERGPVLDVLVGVAAPRQLFAEHCLRGRPATDHVDGGVVSNPVKPGASLDHVRPGAQRRPGVQEGLLHGILRVPVVHQPPAVAPQLAPVALAEGLEGQCVTGCGHGHQPSVRLSAQ